MQHLHEASLSSSTLWREPLRAYLGELCSQFGVLEHRHASTNRVQVWGVPTPEPRSIVRPYGSRAHFHTAGCVSTVSHYVSKFRDSSVPRVPDPRARLHRAGAPARAAARLWHAYKHKQPSVQRTRRSKCTHETRNAENDAHASEVRRRPKSHVRPLARESRLDGQSITTKTRARRARART